MNNNDKSKHNVDDIFDLMSDDSINEHTESNLDTINTNSVDSNTDGNNIDFHYVPTDNDIVFDTNKNSSHNDTPKDTQKTVSQNDTIKNIPKNAIKNTDSKNKNSDITNENSEKPKKYKRHKKYLTPDEKHQRMMNIIYSIIGIVAVYVVAFYYVKYLNNEFYNDLYNSLSIVSENNSYHVEKMDNLMSNEDKLSQNLSLYKIDSDCDGLTDFFEVNTLNTNPLSADSDGDGLNDGIEYIAGLNPLSQMSDGTTTDIDRKFERTISCDSAFDVILSGNAQIYDVSIKNSVSQINNYPGALTGLFGITGLNENIDATIIHNLPDNNIVLVKSNIKDNSFENINFVDNKANINGNSDTSYYFIADGSVFSSDLPIEIMLLIDNSGSMYSADLVENSEANDIDFKRVDFAEKIINSFDNTNLGVAKFTGNYTLLNPITNNKNNLLESVSTIKNGDEFFTGTEISLSIISAIEEFHNPNARRYLIMITDGLPSVFNAENEKRAIELCKEKNISVISIGLGQKIDPEYLSLIAEETNGRFFKAINNLAFDEIYDQINHLILNSDVTSTIINENKENTTIDSLLIGKTGFEKKDYLPLINVPLSDNLANMNLGSAIFSMLYYSGDLPLNTSGYISTNGDEIDGYNLDSFSLLIDGKSNLSELSIECVNNYYKYYNLTDKWDSKKINNSHLSHTVDTNVIVTQNNLHTIRIPFNFNNDESKTLKIARTLTFQKLNAFNSYDCAVIDTNLLNNSDAEIVKAVTYYENILDTKKYQIYSFGLDGNNALDYLINVIHKGISPVLTIDGQIYNVTGISGVIDNNNSYILEMIDISNDCKPCNLVINGNQIYGNANVNYQYTALLNNKEVIAYVLAIN